MSLWRNLNHYRYEAQFRLHAPIYHAAYWRYRRFMMIRRHNYVKNLDACLRHAPKSGCIIECGTWRGGMSAGMADILPGRIHYLFDSFEGLPPATSLDGERAVAYQQDKS